MELTIKAEDGKPPLPVQHRFVKLMLGTAAGFIATALIEGAYEAFLEKQLNKNQTALKIV